jgi:hypothetical protein
MKKRFIMMMAVMVSFAFISCEKNQETNDDEIRQHDPASDADQIEITGYDGLEYFQNSIVVLDENGKPARRVYGEMLDPSDTTILSVCVSDLKMAEEIFLSWVAPEKEVTPVTDGYDYKLTDRDDNPQGSVSFRNADGRDGVLATATVGPNTDLKCFREINFVSDQAWPDNASNVKYETGKTYVIRAQALKIDNCPEQPDPELYMHIVCMMPYTADLTFFCIQGNTDGKEAILVYLSPDLNDRLAHDQPWSYVYWNAHKHCASLPEAEKVLKYYTENYESWEAMIDYMESLGHAWDWHLGWSTTGNEEFILNSYDEKAETIKVLDLDSKEGKIEDVGLGSWFNYRYIFVRTFPPYIGE